MQVSLNLDINYTNALFTDHCNTCGFNNFYVHEAETVLRRLQLLRWSRNVSPCKEPEGPSPSSQEPRHWASQVRSIPISPICLKSILILFSDLRLDHPSDLFSPCSSLKSLYAFSPLPHIGIILHTDTEHVSQRIDHSDESLTDGCLKKNR
jgi:hypothetical protein